MLWLAKDTLAKLRKESAATGEPVAQMIRAVADARADLDPKVVQAFHAEAERQGVGLETVLREALVRAAPVRR